MPKAIDTPIGIYHFLFDRIPGGIPTVAPRPRTINVFKKNDKALVAKVKAGPSVKDAVGQALSLLGGLSLAVKRGDKVVVKPNFNSPDPFPASTDLEFLSVVTQMLLDAGAKVTIGDGAGGVWRPTGNVFDKVGLYDLGKKLGVDIAIFEGSNAADWVNVKIAGDYLTTVAMPRAAYEADKLVYLPCMKTHRLANVSGALKLAFGFVHPGQRRSFHVSNLKQKLAEVNLCWLPHLIVMDGRKSFVTGGPDKGKLATPGLILASGDLIATDIEAARALIENGAQESLPADPWSLPQIVTALKHGLGVTAGGYEVVSGPSR